MRHGRWRGPVPGKGSSQRFRLAIHAHRELDDGLGGRSRCWLDRRLLGSILQSDVLVYRSWEDGPWVVGSPAWPLGQSWFYIIGPRPRFSAESALMMYGPKGILYPGALWTLAMPAE